MNTNPKGRISYIELDLLNSLIAIYDTGNFSAAAKRVSRTPSAISMQVKRLEEIVGHKVFNRDTRSVTLTPAGEKLLRHGRRVLADNQQLMAELARPDMLGEIHFGLLDDLAERYLPQILGNFNQLWPGITIHVLIENTRSLFEKVQQNQLDLALVSSNACTIYGHPVEELKSERIVWAGLFKGCAGFRRPLPITVWEDGCSFNLMAITALDNANIPYIKPVVSYATSGQKLAIMADFVIGPLAQSSLDEKIVDVSEYYDLPPIGSYGVGIFQSNKPTTPPVDTLVNYLRQVIK